MNQQGFPDDDPRDLPPVRGLDTLLTASARDCPGAILFRDADGPVTAQAATDRVAALADHFRQCGLERGERVLLVMGASTRSILALIAALRAGLEPALAPCGLGPVEIAAHARAAEAVALVGPSHYGSLSLGDTYLSAAAVSDGIRLVATLGPHPVDGAADFAPDVLEAPARANSQAESEAAFILTFEGPSSHPTAVSHRQAALLPIALALVDQARINPERALLSTIVPASLAGLVAGPFAAMIGASGLAQHGPFDSVTFLAAYDADPHAHLVLPAEIAPLVREAGMTGDAEAAMILLSRYASPTAFEAPAGFGCERLVVDLYAFGENAVLARRRESEEAEAPAELHDGSLPGRLGVALNRARLESRVLAGGG